MTGPESFAELTMASYLAEAFGAELFAELRRLAVYPERSTEIAAFYKIESETRDLLAGYLDPAGLTVELEKARNEARGYARDLRSRTWHEFMVESQTIGGSALSLYERLQAAAPPPATTDMQRVVDHEEFVLAYAELAVAGKHTKAAELLNRFMRDGKHGNPAGR